MLILTDIIKNLPNILSIGFNILGKLDSITNYIKYNTNQ